MPDGLPSTDASKPVVDPVPRGVDLKLARALLELGVLPSMVTPIIDPVVETSLTPSIVPSSSHSGAVGGRPGSCVRGLSPSAGGGGPS